MTSRNRSLKIDIVADINDLKRKLNDVERTTTQTGQGMAAAGRFIQTAFAGVAAGAVARVIGDLRDLGVEADAIRNRFNVVFGDSADAVADWADEVNERFGVSVETVQDLANGVADLLVPLGFTRQEAAALTQETLQLSNALSEWSGGQIDVADATERVRKALLGERESLEALGVKVLQSDVNARLLAEGQDKLTGAEKARAEASATLAIITEKSADALTAYSAGANEALIAQKDLNAAIADGKQALADFVETEVSSFNDEIGAVGLALAAVSDRLDDFNRSSEDAAEGTHGVTESLLRQVPWLGSTFDALDRVTEKHQDAKREADEYAEATDRARAAAGGFNPALATTAANAGEVADGLGSAVASLKELQDAERAAIDPVFALRNANEKLNEAFEKRVSLQRDGAGASEINAAIQDEIEAAQDLEFARQNLNEAGTDGLELLDRYAEKYLISADALRVYKEEVLGLAGALNGLPSEVRIPTVTGDTSGVRELEQELSRRTRAVRE